MGTLLIWLLGGLLAAVVVAFGLTIWMLWKYERDGSP